MKFEELSVPQLKGIARNVNLRGHSGMKKSELAAALTKTHKLLKSGEVLPRGRAVKKEKNITGGGVEHDDGYLEFKSKMENLVKKCDEVLGGQLPRDITDQVKNLANM